MSIYLSYVDSVTSELSAFVGDADELSAGAVAEALDADFADSTGFDIRPDERHLIEAFRFVSPTCAAFIARQIGGAGAGGDLLLSGVVTLL